MSLVTRLGNLGNVLDENGGQCELLQLDSPVLTSGECQALLEFLGASAGVIDCTFPVAAGEAGLREALTASVARPRSACAKGAPTSS